MQEELAELSSVSTVKAVGSGLRLLKKKLSPTQQKFIDNPLERTAEECGQVMAELAAKEPLDQNMAGLVCLTAQLREYEWIAKRAYQIYSTSVGLSEVEVPEEMRDEDSDGGEITAEELARRRRIEAVGNSVLEKVLEWGEDGSEQEEDEKFEKPLFLVIKAFIEDDQEPKFMIRQDLLQNMLTHDRIPSIVEMMKLINVLVRYQDTFRPLSLLTIGQIVISRNLSLQDWSNFVTHFQWELVLTNKDFRFIAANTEWTVQVRHRLVQCIINAETYDFKALQFVIALNYNLIMIARTMHLRYQTSIRSDPERVKVPSAINQAIGFGDFMEVKLSLMRRYIRLFTYKDAKEFFDTDMPLTYNRNPIKSALLMYETCNFLTRRYSQLITKADKMQSQLITFISEFVQEIEDIDMLQEWLFETDFQGRKTIQLISDFQIAEVMHKLEQLIVKLWKGSLQSGGHIMQTSKLWSELFSAELSQVGSRNAFYQFRPWQLAIRTRYYMSWVNGLVFAILAQVYSNNFVSSLTETIPANEIYLQDTTNTANRDFLEEKAGQLFMNLRAFSFITLFISFEIVIIPSMYMFHKKSGRKFTLSLQMYLLLIEFILTLIPNIIAYEQRLGTLPGATNVEKLQYYKTDAYLTDLTAFLMAIIWFKLINSIRITRLLGPLVKIIGQMLQDIFVFFILFSLVLILFACVGQIEFADIPEYSTLWQATVTLYGAALGDFAFETIDSLRGDIFLMIYLLVNLILMLNLLIAILSNTYTIFDKHSAGLYLQQVLTHYQFYAHDPYSSCIASTNFPMMLFNLIFAPFVLPFKSRKLNDFLQMFDYSFQILEIFALFVILQFGSIPFLYVLNLLRKLDGMCKRKRRLDYSTPETEHDCGKQLLHFLLYLFGGLIYELVRAFIDCGRFFADAYCANFSKKERVCGAPLKEVTVHKLIEALESFTANSDFDYQIKTTDMIIYLRETLGFSARFDDFQIIIKQVQGGLNRQETIGVQKCMSIQDFNRVKDFIRQNSQLERGQYIIYPKILYRALCESAYYQSIKDEAMKNKVAKAAARNLLKKGRTPMLIADSSIHELEIEKTLPPELPSQKLNRPDVEEIYPKTKNLLITQMRKVEHRLKTDHERKNNILWKIEESVRNIENKLTRPYSIREPSKYNTTQLNPQPYVSVKGMPQPSESGHTIEPLADVRSRMTQAEQFMSIEAKRKDLKMNGIESGVRRGSGVFGIPRGTVNSVLSSIQKQNIKEKKKKTIQ